MSESELKLKLPEVDLCKISLLDIINYHKCNICIFLAVILIICIATHLIAYYGFYKNF